MNLKFVLNDYVLIWNLLFQASISESVQKLKEKLWKNYQKQYNALYKEEAKMLKDPKNYIPDDDTIFDMVKATSLYQEIREETESYRLELLKCYDEHKKEITDFFKENVRFDIKIYHILVIHPKLDTVEMKTVKGRKVNTLTWGMRKDEKDYTEALVSILHHALKKELKDYQPNYKDIVDAVIELIIDNELATRLKGVSVYLRGDNTLKFLKKQMYPYFLMYLGAKKEEMLNYMMRDSLAFDIDKYTYERNLVNVDLKMFIDFCVKHQKYIIKIEELEII